MHGDIGTAFFQRGFQLFDKQALATDLVERDVENAVPLSGHAKNLDFGLRIEFAQACLDVFGLPHGQQALT